MNDSNVNILDTKSLYTGYVSLEQLKLKFKKFDEQWSPELERELVKRKPAVGVLLVDPKRDQVVLVEQFRVGALRDKRSPWLYELAAGVIEANEQPEEVAVRETREETGLEVSDVESVMDYWVSPGATDEYMSLYVARVDASKAGGVYGVVSEGEDIQVHVWSFEKVFEALDQGLVANAPAIIAIQWLKLHAEKLKRKWLGDLS